MWKKLSNNGVVRKVKTDEKDNDDTLSLASTSSSTISSLPTTDPMSIDSSSSNISNDTNGDHEMLVDDDDSNDFESKPANDESTSSNSNLMKGKLSEPSKPSTTGKARKRKRTLTTSSRKAGAGAARYSNDNQSGNPNLNYQYTCHTKEDHKQEIYFVAFNCHLKPGQPKIFATVGRNRVSIYECLEKTFKLLQAFEDPDPLQRFYTCAWTTDPTGKSLLAAAGVLTNKEGQSTGGGIIRIFSPAKGECIKHLLGHTQIINHLCFSPKDCNLLLTASGDHSLRLWNINSGVLIAVFTGDCGHRDQVLTCDFHQSGQIVVSGGMDHAVKVWRLDKEEISNLIADSHKYNSNSRGSFPTRVEAFPDFSDREMHSNYVDSIAFFGDIFLSKSSRNSKTNEIICWKPGRPFETWDEIDLQTSMKTRIHSLWVEDCGVWYLRFGLDLEKKILALGNECGKIKIFDLTASDPNNIQSATLSHKNCTMTVRSCSFSRDRQVLLAVCDDSTIWRYDLQT